MSGEGGVRYEIDGNSLICPDGSTRIWVNEKGEYHRFNGPAIVWTDGRKEWYLHGRRLINRSQLCWYYIISQLG